MVLFAEYSDILGKPGEGVHSYKILNLAVVDIIATFILALVLQTYIFTTTSYMSVLSSTWITAIILHRLFNVKTTIDKLLFPSV
jgi:hypothetical protein